MWITDGERDQRLLEGTGLPEQSSEERSFVVSGQVLRSDGLPFKGALVRALHEGETGAIPPSHDSTGAEDRCTIRYGTNGGRADRRSPRRLVSVLPEGAIKP